MRMDVQFALHFADHTFICKWCVNIEDLCTNLSLLNFDEIQIDERIWVPEKMKWAICVRVSFNALSHLHVKLKQIAVCLHILARNAKQLQSLALCFFHIFICILYSQEQQKKSLNIYCKQKVSDAIFIFHWFPIAFHSQMEKSVIDNDAQGEENRMQKKMNENREIHRELAV